MVSAYNGKSKMTTIQDRLKEVYPDDIKKAVYKMVSKEIILTSGGRKNRSYELPKKNK